MTASPISKPPFSEAWPANERTLATTWARSLRIRRLRTMAQFAEQEIILPDGPCQGLRFRLRRSPVARLLFAELDSGRWQKAFVTGPNQDGKSLLGFVIPTLYLLFELRQTVILGVPSLELVSDKWSVNLLPAIKASRYRRFLPTRGAGSREGESISYAFGNGARLRFMTAGGDDKSRASYTSPNLVVTETDGFDVVGKDSREGDKLQQLFRRTLAFGGRARIICECTTSTEKGRTWHEYTHGSHSRIVLPCPHCGKWVTPDREQLTGWQDAPTELDAIDATAVCCPECGATWTNQQRLDANQQARLLHKGQDIAADGSIAGEMPRTNVLGFRWSCVNSVLDPERLKMVGGVEWAAKRAADEDKAERDLVQSQWALPAKPDQVDLTQLDAFAIMRRTLPLKRGLCPAGTQVVTVACDVGKWLCHWTAIAWRANATPHVIDYGRLEVPSRDMGEETAILVALRDWRDEVVNHGWPVRDSEQILKPAFRFVDCGDWQATIFTFVNESGPGWFATKGYGIGQRRGDAKRDTGSLVIGQGEKYAVVQLPSGQVYVEINTDHWKSWLHARVHTPVDQAGALTLWDSGDHLSFGKHLTSERRVEEFNPREGWVQRWEREKRSNHWFDSTVLTCVGGHAAGMRLIDEPKQAAAAKPEAPVQPERPAWMPERPSDWMPR